VPLRVPVPVGANCTVVLQVEPTRRDTAR
jgi:hypothetical protein